MGLWVHGSGVRSELGDGVGGGVGLAVGGAVGVGVGAAVGGGVMMIGVGAAFVASATGTGGDGGRRKAAQIAKAAIPSATSPPSATGRPDGMMADFSSVPGQAERRRVHGGRPDVEREGPRLGPADEPCAASRQGDRDDRGLAGRQRQARAAGCRR